MIFVGVRGAATARAKSAHLSPDGIFPMNGFARILGVPGYTRAFELPPPAPRLGETLGDDEGVRPSRLDVRRHLQKALPGLDGVFGLERALDDGRADEVLNSLQNGFTEPVYAGLESPCGRPPMLGAVATPL